MMTGLPLSIAELPELVARTHEGDERAFATLVGKYQPLVFRWAIALSGDEDEAEDICQEVFVRVHRKLGSFRGDGPFEGWLYRITRRVASRARQKSVPQVTSTTQEVYVTDPGARVDRQRAVELIRLIAETLPLRQREVFLLCDIEGRTPAETAATLDMKRRLRARESVQGARSDQAQHPRHTSLLQGSLPVNCNDYLAMLETLPTDELAYGHAREHALQCRDCDRVTRVVVERERNMRLAFGDVESSVAAAQTTAYARETSRRRRIVRFYEVAVGIAMAAGLVFFVVTQRVPPRFPAGTTSETFRLQCLSPHQAAEVLRPYATNGSISVPSSALGIIRVQASHQEMQKARAVLDRFDNAAQSQCAVRVIVPKTP